MAEELRAVPFSALPQADDGYTVLYENDQVCRSEKKLSELVGDKTSSFLTKEQGDSLYQEKGDYLVNDDITGKLDTTAFSDVSGNFLTAHQSLDEYATQEWVNNQGFLKEHQPISANEWNDVYETVVTNSGTWGTETDWSDDISAASAYAYEQAVAQIPPPFDPTFLSSEIDKKMDKTFSSNFYPMNENPSGYLTHQDLSNYYTKNETSGAEELANAFANIPLGDVEVNELVHSNSAEWNNVSNKLDTTAFSDVSGDFLTNEDLEGYATEELVQNVSGEITALIPTNYYPDNNPSGFITGVDLTPYQTISGMTAYQPAGDYATTNYVNEEIGKIGSYVTATLSGGVPDVQNPSTKVIYLTKDESVTGIDQYQEWIYDTTSSWDCIGDTSISLDDYVMKTQTAVSIGSNNTATAPNSFSQGSNNSNTTQSFTQGSNNTAGAYSIAQGYNNNAGSNSLAQGSNNKAGFYSLSQGESNSAGDYCVTVGYSNSANSYSFAQGYKNSATLDGFTQGQYNYANCQAFAVGESAVAITKSFAQGHNVIASSNSFAQGFGTSAETDSFAQGTNTSATDYSFVQGRNNESYSYSFVQGAANIADTDGFAQGQSNSGFLMSLAQGWGNRAQSGSLAVGDSNTAYSEGVTIGAKNYANIKSFTQGGLNSAMNVSFAQGEVNNAQTRGFAQGTNNTAIMAAAAIGQCNSANNQSVAFGEFNNAGTQSIAVGACNSATSKSLAIGAKTSAHDNSLAVGGGVTAKMQSFAQGGGNSANYNSFVQGGGNSAEYNSMAQGGGNSAYSGSIAQGGGNSAINYSQAFGLHSIITDYGMAIGKYNKTSADAYFVIGNGYVDQSQSPFVTVRSDLFVIDKTGNVSAKSGFFYDKNGKVGGGTTYRNGYLISIDNNFKLNFTNLYCTANSAKYNVAIGDRTLAEGSASVAMGKYTTAYGDYSHSEGEKTKASGAYSHAEGTYTTANGDYAHTEGYYTSASTSGAHAEGYWTKANGETSHTEGFYTVTNARWSHAEGYQTTASGQGSHAEGSNTRAIGDYSLSVGENTSAKGYCSFAGGGSTVANYSNQVVIGKYNDNKTNTLFEVGNGVYDNRTNALEVYKDGTVSGGDFVAGGVSLSSLTPVTLTYRTVGE